MPSIIFLVSQKIHDSTFRIYYSRFSLIYTHLLFYILNSIFYIFNLFTPLIIVKYKILIALRSKPIHDSEFRIQNLIFIIPLLLSYNRNIPRKRLQIIIDKSNLGNPGKYTGINIFVSKFSIPS